MKTAIFSAFLVSAATASNAGIPLTNATCPGNIEVHADQGGPIYINGKEAELQIFSNTYYEARGGGVTISLSVRPDGSPSVSYTGRGGANGVCQLAAAGIQENNRPSGGDFADGDTGGPDFWAVTGVASNDRLNVRAGRSTRYETVARLRNGTVVRNLGCRQEGNSRWCRIGLVENGSITGWVNGRFLRESGRPNVNYPNNNQNNAGDVPEIAVRSTGEMEVRWRSGCTALYDRFGRQITAGRSCTSAQLGRSAVAVRAYMREQGIPGTGRPPSAAGYEIVPKGSGGVDVKYRDGCWISYDRNARRGGHAGHCSQWQYQQADNAARSYLR